MQTIQLPFRLKNSILACGGDLKGSFALAKGGRALLVEGFGDLALLDNFTKYAHMIKECEKRFRIRPRVIASDLHPSYFSARFAENYHLSVSGYRLCKIQHHHAHVASGVVDNNVRGKVIGVAFDGTGFGLDGNIWGGEFFVGDLGGFERIAHFEYIPVPGGDMAVREPWRMGASYLYRVYGKDFLTLPIDFTKKIHKRKWQVLKTMIDKKINSPLTSSAGRLFDAVGSIVFAKEKVDFEAELPIELERIAVESCVDHYPYALRRCGGESLIDVSAAIRSIVKDLSKRADPYIISSKFHNTIADIIVAVVRRARKRTGVRKVVLTGGVFQNRFLTAKASSLLKKGGFIVYTHSHIPANDSGIPIGQVAIAHKRFLSRM